MWWCAAPSARVITGFTPQVNEFVKRVRAFKIHMLIISHLRKQMPVMMGKKSTQDKLCTNLANEFQAVQREHHLPPGAWGS